MYWLFKRLRIGSCARVTADAASATRAVRHAGGRRDARVHAAAARRRRRRAGFRAQTADAEQAAEAVAEFARGRVRTQARKKKLKCLLKIPIEATTALFGAERDADAGGRD